MRWWFKEEEEEEYEMLVDFLFLKIKFKRGTCFLRVFFNKKINSIKV